MAHRDTVSASDPARPEVVRRAEAALRRFGYARVPPTASKVPGDPAFWVQESGVPRRTFPVYVPGGPSGESGRYPEWAERPSEVPSARRAIVVVPSDHAAEQAWETLRGQPGSDPAAELSILVLPGHTGGEEEPRWHAGTVSPRELLRVATGVVVGLFQRSQSEEGSTQIDFQELLRLLRQRFGIDVHRSLGISSDEDALFLLYQLALRDSYAPGEGAANLHVLVLKPTGPAARLPWFAA